MINWHIRYSKIINSNKELLDTNKSILEIGSGLNGIAEYLKRPVTGIDTRIEGHANKWLTLLKGDVLALDFQDNFFDYVICVDVLEHIHSDQRAKAIAEMLRVTRYKLIISCPCDNIAYMYDLHLSNLLKKMNSGIPEWLYEHLSHGLPEEKDILRTLMELGAEFKVTGNEGIMQHYGGVLLDLQFDQLKPVYESHKNKTFFSAPVAASEWDRYYSYLFEVGKKNIIYTDVEIAAISENEIADVPQISSAIYTVFHQDIDSKYLHKLIPIYAGSVAEKYGTSCLTDQLEDSPSLLNTRWSELSAIYKIWKEGPFTDVVGFTHYRRLFNFCRQDDVVDRRDVSFDKFKESYSEKTYDHDYVCSLLNIGILVAEPVKLNETIWEQYCDVHNTNDWCWVLSKILKDYPYLMKYALEQFESKTLYAYNMFVTNRVKFDELCSLWFDILLEFESQVPPGRANNYQNRDISFMAERIFDIWVRYKKDMGEEIRHLPIFFIDFEQKAEICEPPSVGEGQLIDKGLTAGDNLPIQKNLNILIIKPGAIGDLLHLTPVVRALKNHFPHSRLTMLVGSRLSATIFEYNPYVDESIIFEKKGAHKSLKGLIRLWKELHARRFDLVLNYQRSNLKGWFLASSSFPCRVLVYHKSRTRMIHAVENHLEPLAALGIDPQTTDTKLDFYPSFADQQRADALLDRVGIIGSRVIAFNPGTNHLCKCWPLDRFARLADRVIEQLGAEIIILGSREEKKLADEILAGMSNVAYDLTGCTLGELGAILKKVDVFITGDTGPMHISVAVGTPVLALYGPISPLRSGPLGSGHRVIIHDDLDCCPCNSFKCVNPVFRLCMESITVDEVFAVLSEMLDT